MQQLPFGQDSAAISQWAGKIVAEAACVLVVMSPEFVELGSGAELRLSALAHNHRGRGRSVCVITDESVTSTSTTTADSLPSVSIADIHEEAVAWRLVEDAVRECGARSYIRRAVALSAGGVVFPGMGVTKANLPAVNHNFVGRANELTTLHAWLVKAPGSVADRCVAIYAMSGMGKTQLATEFVTARSARKPVPGACTAPGAGGRARRRAAGPPPRTSNG